jgi:DNA-directed RNA polymerase subunit RPC12/RpoP
MNSNVICPDCNSQDIQEIVKDNLLVKNRGCIGGCLGRKGKTETVKYRYYTCRSCGKEFHS